MKKGIKLEEIIELHRQGLIPIRIAESLNCSSSNITRRLKKAGITPIRDYTSRKMPSRLNRHKVNEAFFDYIDTEAKAYFLGLMFSDGSVSRNQFYIKLKDEDILLKFRDALQCNYPILYREFPYKSYCLQVSS